MIVSLVSLTTNCCKLGPLFWLSILTRQCLKFTKTFSIHAEDKTIFNNLSISEVMLTYQSSFLKLDLTENS